MRVMSPATEHSRTATRRTALALALAAALATGAWGATVGARPTGDLAETAARVATVGAKGKAAHKTLVTFIGYRRLAADTDQVYVELTESAEVETTRTGRTLEFTIHDAKVTRKNNKNPLIASQFDSIVESARLVQAGKSVRLVIRLRAAAEPQHRVVPRSGGATLEVNLTRKSGALPPDDQPKKKRKKRKTPKAEP
jgi:hypothetical protein